MPRMRPTRPSRRQSRRFCAPSRRRRRIPAPSSMRARRRARMRSTRLTRRPNCSTRRPTPRGRFSTRPNRLRRRSSTRRRMPPTSLARVASRPRRYLRRRTVAQMKGARAMSASPSQIHKSGTNGSAASRRRSGRCLGRRRRRLGRSRRRSRFGGRHGRRFDGGGRRGRIGHRRVDVDDTGNDSGQNDDEDDRSDNSIHGYVPQLLIFRAATLEPLRGNDNKAVAPALATRPLGDHEPRRPHVGVVPDALPAESGFFISPYGTLVFYRGEDADRHRQGCAENFVLEL